MTAKKYWFKASRYGWWRYPKVWQGWLIILIYLLVLFLSFPRVDTKSYSVSDTLINFLPRALIFTPMLLIICLKTGEKHASKKDDE